ncbi:hypothetical protein AVEN_42014-1 [Araneus ventricosus]|uniref:Uncharacterized protein n=1 Tax=Araneus ventricosus TaxID=182803 RepID=A0A4Y2P6R2_ARAVE|nr:hypothetical protein AVEN_263989-1 [Araneus ventricosus]GBN41015.1 hypothetical protein AVEN_71268-1 [Araneus ventricosus]GBN45716.1 hypothetical protein AVEN_42014-1 [Araneus ventricosus]
MHLDLIQGYLIKCNDNLVILISCFEVAQGAIFGMDLIILYHGKMMRTISEPKPPTPHQLEDILCIASGLTCTRPTHTAVFLVESSFEPGTFGAPKPRLYHLATECNDKPCNINQTIDFNSCRF